MSSQPDNRFSDGLNRAFRRFGIPSRLVTPEEKMVDPEKKVTTSAYDADKAKREKLGAMTANEERLFRQGGLQAVIEDRRWQAKESGDPTWKEIGKTRWTVKADEGQVRPMVEGTGPATVDTGKAEGKQEQANRAPIALPILPSPNRPVAGETGDDKGRDTADPETGRGARSSEGTATAGREGVREGIRPSTQPRGKTPVEESTAVAPSVLPTVPKEDRTGSAEDVEAVGAENPVKRRGGRPRKYADDAERARAYRARRG